MDHIFILNFHFCPVERLSNNVLHMISTLANSTILDINLDAMEIRSIVWCSQSKLLLFLKDSCFYIQNDKEETNESRKVVAYRGGSRSPSSEERYKGHHSKRISSGGRSDDGSFKYYYDERRSPRYPQENSRHGGPRRSSARFEVVDDRFRDDEHGSRRLSNTESKLVIRSPDIQKNVDRSRSPVVPPVGDILGDNVHPLQVGVLSKPIDGKDADGSAHIGLCNRFFIFFVWTSFAK